MNLKRAAAVMLSLMLTISLAACGSEAAPDEHEGQVYVNTGGSYEWITPAEGVAASVFKEEDFDLTGGWPEYTGEEYTARRGVDVSFYQGEIDWEAVAADGIEFAMIRCGYRGSETGPARGRRAVRGEYRRGHRGPGWTWASISSRSPWAPSRRPRRRSSSSSS